VIWFLIAAVAYAACWAWLALESAGERVDAILASLGVPSDDEVIAELEAQF